MATFYKFVYYLLLWQYICQNQLEEGRVYFCSQFIKWNSVAGALRQLVTLLPHSGNPADGRWCSAHVLPFCPVSNCSPCGYSPVRRASYLGQPNPESPPQTHPWLIAMVIPNSVKLTILINQWTVLGLNSEDISMFRTNFHVNYIISLFVFLKNNSQKPILMWLWQKSARLQTWTAKQIKWYPNCFIHYHLCENMFLVYFYSDAQHKCRHECSCVQLSWEKVYCGKLSSCVFCQKSFYW